MKNKFLNELNFKNFYLFNFLPLCRRDVYTNIIVMFYVTKRWFYQKKFSIINQCWTLALYYSQ